MRCNVPTLPIVVGRELCLSPEDKNRWVVLEVDAELKTLKAQIVAGTHSTHEIDFELQALKAHLGKEEGKSLADC